MFLDTYIKSPLFISNPQPIFIYRFSDLHIIDINEAAIQEYGYTRDEFLSLTTEDLRPEGEIAKIMNVVKNESIGSENIGIWKHKRKDGSLFIINMFLFTLEENDTIYKVAQITNIRPDHELSLNADTIGERLTFHLKNTPLLYIEWNNNLRIKNFSIEFITKYQFNFADLFNQTYEDLLQFVVDEKDEEVGRHLMYQVLEEKKNKTQGEIRFYDKNKDIIYTQWYNSILRDSYGRPVSILSLVEDNTKQKLIDKRLEQQNKLINTIINSLPGIFYMIDKNGHYIRWNKNFKDLLGLTDEEMAIRNFNDFYTKEELDKIWEKINTSYKEGISTAKIHIRDAKGQKPLYQVTGIPIPIENKNYILGMGVNITNIERTQNELSNSLHEKEVLLTEIHHRVKNNLAIISGLLELATFSTDQKEVNHVLKNSMLRIKSMALIHEKLYRSEDLSKINMRDYIPNLTDFIASTLNYNTDIDFKSAIDDVKMNVNQAIPTGLIINEAVTNSLEHAFTDQDQGIISIHLRKKKDQLFLEINDNGKGFDTDIDFTTLKTMGIKLIHTLAKQLNAQLSLVNDNGTKIGLTFKAIRPQTKTNKSFV